MNVFRLPILTIFLLSTTFEANGAIGSNDSREPTGPTVLVVAPPVFDDALRPWVEYRRAQGYDVVVSPLAATRDGSADGEIDFGVRQEPVATPEEIRARIREIARTRNLAAILLVGDGAPTFDAKFGWRDVVPAPRVDARVVQTFGSEPHIATDSFYSDLDDDGVPDVAIGRIPVETPDELRAVVRKILRYETASPVGNWTRKVEIFAGPNGLDLGVVGSAPGSASNGSAETGGASRPSLAGISSFVDSVVDNLSRQLFAEFLPQETAITQTRCSLKSQFCPYPPDFGEAFVERANEGSLIFLYLGHGRVFGLDRFQTSSGGDYGLFEIDDVERLNAPNQAPVAFFFACYTGAYDANERSLAEDVALSPNGPVAVFAASRLTAPYGMCVLGASLLESAFDEKGGAKTLGEIVLRAQRKTLEPLPDEEESDEPAPKRTRAKDASVSARDADESKSEPDLLNEKVDRINARLERELRDFERKRASKSIRRTLDRAAAIFDPTAARLDEQLADHVALFNLFGDPLTRVKFPERVAVEAPEIAYSTKKIAVSGEIPGAPDGATVVQAELARADFKSPVGKPRRSREFVESDAARIEFDATYRAANEFVVDAVRVPLQNGRFDAEIVVPADFSGESVVRIAATDGTRYWTGSKRLVVRPFTPRPEPPKRTTSDASEPTAEKTDSPEPDLTFDR